MSSPTTGKPIALPSRLSPSALSRYRSCPKQFYLSDIERLSRDEGKTPNLAQGNAIHEALHLFYGLELVYRSNENLEKCLRSVWCKHARGVFQTREEEATAGIASIGMLRGYADKFDISAEPVVRETWAGIRIGGVSLYGKIDRVDRNGAGLDLIDYKTGQRAIDREDLRHEPAVQVYVLGAEGTFKLPVERVRFIYLALGHEVVWEPEREDVEQLGVALLKTRKDIREDERFEARPGQGCGFCPVQIHCADKDRVEIEAVASAAQSADEELPF
jgi:RecB family exonuclease